MLIPNAEHATVLIEKLRDYALDELYPVGRDKARVFRAALGWTKLNADELKGLLLEAVQTLQTAEYGKADKYGQRYILDIPYISRNGNEVMIRSTWILDNDGAPPRLTSCYVLNA
jgi:hypothetical protein